MWRCPQCDTLNNEEEYCYVCHHPRAVPYRKVTSARRRQDSVNQTLERRAGASGGLVTAVILMLCLLVGILAAMGVYYFTQHGKSAAVDVTENTQEEVSPEELDGLEQPVVYYINRLNESITVRTEPSASSEAVATIAAGDTHSRLRYYGTETDSDGVEWFQVRTTDRQIGYVRADSVAMAG